MTALDVTAVNVHVSSIHVEKNTEEVEA
jgi:uncharacterized alkaline shock family protein YloU